MVVGGALAYHQRLRRARIAGAPRPQASASREELTRLPALDLGRRRPTVGVGRPAQACLVERSDSCPTWLGSDHFRFDEGALVDAAKAPHSGTWAAPARARLLALTGEHMTLRRKT